MDIAGWVAAYADAWEGADDAAAAALFSGDAVYHSNPFGEPHRGTEGIRAYWRRATRTQSGVDVLMGHPIGGDRRHAVEWWTTMHDTDEGEVTLPGILLLLFDRDGKCAQLREYWVLRGGHIPPHEGWGEAAGRNDAAADAVERWRVGFDGAWRHLDPGALAPLYAGHSVYRTDPFEPPHHGLSGILGHRTQAFASEDDVRPRWGKPFVSGDTAAIEHWTLLEESGVATTRTGCEVLRFDADGLVVETRSYTHRTEGEREPFAGWGT